MVPLAEHIELRLPVARGINPVTGGNWEGTGVQPDIRVPAEEALDVALQAALETA
jgi:C-terminal processing protease CtpA/Prc